jgi:hypothetical protein
MSPDTTAKSADVNSNFAALNGATAPNFTSCEVGSQPVVVQGAGSYAGFHLFIGPTTPTGMVKGDVWIKTPF